MKLKINRGDYDNIWFTSDLHFHHKNILNFQKNRPYDTLEDMNEGLIKMWNDTVSDDDLIFVLGDVTFNNKLFDDVMIKLQGEKVLIFGNHDHLPPYTLLLFSLYLNTIFSF